MRIDDADIGQALQPGSRIGLNGSVTVMVIDADGPIETAALLVRRDSFPDVLSQGDIMVCDKTDETHVYSINMGAIEADERLLVCAYSPDGPMPGILTTLSSPRVHSAQYPGGHNASVLAEIYTHEGGRRLKASAERYSGGLSEILKAYSRK